MSKSDWQKKYIGETDTSLSFFIDLIEKKRVEIFSPYISKNSLEIGPGIGTFCEAVAITHALDISKIALERLKIRCPTVRTVSYTHLPLPFKSKKFNAIACNDVIHHVQEVTDLFQFNDEVHRILKPGGYLLISDRQPTRYVKSLLEINAFFRKIFLMLSPSKMTLGSEIELPMKRAYYDALFADYDIIHKIKWRSTLSSLLIGMSFFLNLIFPATWIKFTVLPVVSWLEKNFCVLPTDYLLVLQKK